MRIGFDFDNTIVNYEKLFHKVALEQGLIDDSVPKNKIAVRNYLRSIDQEREWTTMQGYVYGPRILEADSYTDVISVMQRLKKAGHTLMIISHRTKYPYLGEAYDLHAAARAWIDAKLCADGQPLLPNEAIFLCLTKEEKLKTIADQACDLFMDDLPEIVLSPLFSKQTQAYLFDPEKRHEINEPHIKIVPSWEKFASDVL